MNITIDRLNHSITVANRMKEIVSQNSDKFYCSANEAFIIGYLHDIGYKFVDNLLDHAHKGGEVLKEQGYKYWKEIYYHGLVQNEYHSNELDLLNFIDITTGPQGQILTVQERIEDICQRYGKKSLQTQMVIEMSEYLEKNFKI